MHIKAVIFDADGVVLIPKRFSDYLEREYNITRAQTHDFFYGALEECIRGRADLKEILPPFLGDWRWPHGTDRFLLEWFPEGNAVDQRVLDAIVSLRERGLLCCLATNQEKYRIEYMRTAMGFDAIFDHIFFAAEVGYKKTDPPFFAHVQQTLGLQPAELLLWDDGDDNVQVARGCGWHAELYVDFEGFERTLADYLVG